MDKTRRTYTDEFKKDAVQRYRSGDKTISAIAKGLGIRPDMLSRWNREFDKENAFPGNGNPRDKAKFALKKEIAILTEECAILKKSNEHFLSTAETKYQFMKDHEYEYTIGRMAKILKVARSGYYAWLLRLERKRSTENKN